MTTETAPPPRVDRHAMSLMERIRRQYRVPAKRGMRVLMAGRPAVITGTQRGCMRLMLRLDGQRHTEPAHPTWRMDYLDGRGER